MPKDLTRERARSKSEFRAIRERCGITQALLAREMGVAQRSVRYWEDPDSMRVPPNDAWDMLDDALEDQRLGMEAALDRVEEIAAYMASEGVDVPLKKIELPYWLSEFDYLAHSTDAARGVAGDWQMANANNRALSIALEERGITVRWTDGNPARPDAE